MKKIKEYKHTYFDANVLKLAKAKFDEISRNEFKYDYTSFSVSFETESWAYDNLEEFFADYRKTYITSHLELRYQDYVFDVESFPFMNYTRISIYAPSRNEIETIFGIFDDNASKFYIAPSKEEIEKEKAVIFLAHGQNSQWRDLKDHLHEKHGFRIEAYETGARAGHTIRDILESMLDKSSFAILVLTGEDETKEGNFRARQNVIHESGLFQGRLGFNRAIVLLEEGTEEFSNINGLQQIRFLRGKIIETFGEVLATIRREFNEN